jgi:hypothetical protein
MVTLNDALMELVTKKLITPEEGYSKAIDKPGMELTMKRAGFDPAKLGAGPAAGAPAAAAAAGAAGAAPGAPVRPAPPART